MSELLTIVQILAKAKEAEKLTADSAELDSSVEKTHELRQGKLHEMNKLAKEVLRASN